MKKPHKRYTCYGMCYCDYTQCNCHTQLKCNMPKNQTWLITSICMMCTLLYIGVLSATKLQYSTTPWFSNVIFYLLIACISML